MATQGKITGERQKRHSRYIDMWVAPGLHPTNVNLLAKLKSAEDRQFSSNMGVTGKMIDEDRQEGSKEESHIIGLRTDVWSPSKKERKRVVAQMQKSREKELRSELKSDGRLNKSQKAVLDAKLEDDHTMAMDESDVDKQRLVLKMFKSTGKRIRWKGTLEEMTVHEVHNSLGSKRALITFAVILPDYDYMVHIQQNRPIIYVPPTFSFAYYEEANDRMWYIDLKMYWVSFGIDFKIEAQGRRIGKIDGKLWALGTDSRIHVHEPTLAKDQKFMDLLSLFSSSIGYHKRIRKNIRSRVSKVKRGRSMHIIEDEELWLLKNPRRLVR